MKTKSFGKLALPLLISLGMLITSSQTSAAELLVGVSSKNRLVVFASDDPEDVMVVHLRGLQPGEEILGIDVRPATGDLYALGSSSRIYTIDLETRTATAVGSGPFTPALRGTRFGFDFNPVVDRIRVVSDQNQNLRLHPDTGLAAATDVDLAYASGDPGFGSTPDVVGAAYINNDTNTATGTTLYVIDAARDVLAIQNPPNSGTLNTVGSLGLNTSWVVGFDVAGSDGTAYASLLAEGGKRTDLYTIDLATGAATLLGKIGGPKPLRSLASLGSIE